MRFGKGKPVRARANATRSTVAGAGVVVDDGSDDLDERERAALDAAISRSLEEEAAGRTAPSEAILARLRARSST